MQTGLNHDVTQVGHFANCTLQLDATCVLFQHNKHMLCVLHKIKTKCFTFRKTL
jgi:hypothetical protein